MEFILIFGKLFGYTPTYANVSSGESPQGWQMSDVTTNRSYNIQNFWNMQVFNEENANLFVILFIKGLLVRTNVRT